MKRGKKPTPTNLKILRGNPGKRALPKDEPTPQATCPPPPAVLSSEAKKHWRIVVKQLYDADLMTNMDIDALMLLCQAYSTWVEAGKALQKDGLLIEQASYNGETTYLKQSPWLMVQQKAFDQMKGMLVEFGMSPSSRTRVRTVDRKQPTDGWDDA